MECREGQPDDFLLQLRKLCDTLAHQVLALAGHRELDPQQPAQLAGAACGITAYAEVNPDYTDRPDPSELMPTLQRLQHAHAA